MEGVSQWARELGKLEATGYHEDFISPEPFRLQVQACRWAPSLTARMFWTSFNIIRMPQDFPAGFVQHRTALLCINTLIHTHTHTHTHICSLPTDYFQQALFYINTSINIGNSSYKLESCCITVPDSMKAVPQIMVIMNFSPGSFKIPVSKLESVQKAQCCAFRNVRVKVSLSSYFMTVTSQKTMNLTHLCQGKPKTHWSILGRSAMSDEPNF
jgi:hypothetical protein